MTDEIPFDRELAFRYGVLEAVAPGIRRLVARNPSPFTFHGTGTYVIGDGEVAVVDPGPALPEHVDALLRALAAERVSHILVTHTHRDHSPAARLLQQATGAPTYGFGPHGGGAGEVEEGADRDFTPDVTVRDGERIDGAGWSVECVHTPGHTSNHICYQYREQRALMCGDHVMAWSTSIISPPDGDLTDYLASLERLLQRDDAVYWPTHGAAITDPKPFVRAYLAHRQRRIREVLACLDEGVGTIAAMVPAMYSELPVSMHPAAAQSVLATLIYLVHGGMVRCDGTAALASRYWRVTGGAV